MNTDLLCKQFLSTPIGTLAIVANDHSLLQVGFVDKAESSVPANAITQQAFDQLQAYFAGKQITFDLPLGAQGTLFQHQVWQALQGIRYGNTCSYQDIAHRLNNPKAVRAVGAANARNPLAIVVPCHRVIGANGALTGYAGGLSRKAWLLNHETPSRTFDFSN